ncbi:MAG: carboxypeptidase-like regulatory domain-containing protein, partial [Paramuribaculum sp.]|nr:carboxypeptidase-like regulatory domain-containing protein [Paramuribaculum sp.]
MLKKILFAAMAFAMAADASIYASNLSAPTDANIVGHVVDAVDGEHLPFCLITLEGSKLTVMTDASGHYTLRDLKPGHYTLTAAYTGYSPASLSIDVEAGKTVEANFELKADAFMLDQVVVTSNKRETRRRESPSLVNVTAGSLLSNIGACSLADGLDFQPGVRV